jgi:hypothetical protein
VIVLGNHALGTRRWSTRRRSSSPSPRRCSAPAPLDGAQLDHRLMLIIALVLSA